MTSTPDALPSPSITQQRPNAAVVARLWDAFNTGAVDVLEQLVQREFTNFGQTRNGPRFLAELIAAQRAAFPDMHFTIL